MRHAITTLAAALAVLGAVLAPIPARAVDGVTDDTVTIGVFGPITGPAAYVGLGGRDGMNLAIKEINAAGGINGRKLRVLFEVVHGFDRRPFVARSPVFAGLTEVL